MAISFKDCQQFISLCDFCGLLCCLIDSLLMGDGFWNGSAIELMRISLPLHSTICNPRGLHHFIQGTLPNFYSGECVRYKEFRILQWHSWLVKSSLREEIPLLAVMRYHAIPLQVRMKRKESRKGGRRERGEHYLILVFHIILLSLPLDIVIKESRDPKWCEINGYNLLCKALKASKQMSSSCVCWLVGWRSS